MTNERKVTLSAAALIVAGALGLYMGITGIVANPITVSRYLLAISAGAGVYLGIRALVIKGETAWAGRLKDSAAIVILVQLLGSFVVVLPPQRWSRSIPAMMCALLLLGLSLVLFVAARQEAALETVSGRKAGMGARGKAGDGAAKKSAKKS